MRPSRSPKWIETAPDDFARGDQCVEIRRENISEDARAESPTQERRRQRRALEVLDRVKQRIETAPLLQYALPVRLEAREHLLFDRLDLFAEPGQGFSANLAQHFGVAPFAMNAARDGILLRRCGHRVQARAGLLLSVAHRGRIAEPPPAR